MTTDTPQEAKQNAEEINSSSGKRYRRVVVARHGRPEVLLSNALLSYNRLANFRNTRILPRRRLVVIL